MRLKRYRSIRVDKTLYEKITIEIDEISRSYWFINFKCNFLYWILSTYIDFCLFYRILSSSNVETGIKIRHLNRKRFYRLRLEKILKCK